MDRKIGFAASLVCAAGAAAVWPRLTVRQYTLKSRKVHVPFHFVLLSDLHRSRYGIRQRDLILAVVPCPAGCHSPGGRYGAGHRAA